MEALLEIVNLNAASIIAFIGSEVIKQGIGWLTNTALDALFKDKKQSEDLKNKLKTIHEELDLIRVALKRTTIQIERTHLNNRIFQAEMDICNKFQLLQSILSIEESSERSSELERLTKGILDTNHGILSNLFVIHHVLIGHTLTNPAEKGLIEMWSKGVYDEMILRPISAKAYLDTVMKYFDEAAILQFKGYILFWGANENKRFCSDQCYLIMENLKLQNDIMEQTIPKTMMVLANPDESKLLTFRTVSNGSPSKCLVMGSHLGDKLQLKTSVENFEALWILKKSSSFDKDGSLIISTWSYGETDKQSHIDVSEHNGIVTCASEGQSFFVIPLHFDNNSNEIIICKSESGPQRYLGNSLEFTDIQENIKFTMTIQSKSELVLYYDHNAKGPTNCLRLPGGNRKRGGKSTFDSFCE